MTNGTAQFALSLLHALLENLPQIPQCWSAGALRWYFSLLSRSIVLDSVGIAAQKALTLLQQVAQHLHARQNPYHLLLQTRLETLELMLQQSISYLYLDTGKVMCLIILC